LFQNKKPVIGILTQPSSWVNIYDSEDYSYLASSYVKSLESAGAKIVPIKYDMPFKNLTLIFANINGLFIPGGGTDLILADKETGFLGQELTEFG